MSRHGQAGAAPQIYSSEYYQRLAALENHHWWHRGMREIAATLIHSQGAPASFPRVLDAGCGTGAGLMWEQDVLGSRLVIGMDLSWHALTFCQSHVGGALLQGSVLELPFRPSSFDLIVCQDVLQHLPTDGADARVIAAFYQILRPGGLLLVRANSRLGMWQENNARDADFQRYTLPEIVSLLRTAGFFVKRATYANALPALYASIKRWLSLHYHHGTHPHRLYEGLRVRDTATRHAWLNQLLLWVLRAEARYLLAPRAHLQFGHSTFCLAVRPSGDRL